ncbi:hypothetical protein OIDMADRAFT_23798 [Oidiodendron maius Zn]|uniref:Uncharacterized protein n=1 Tax=Oidiodendron maius (strain Zn) TaxID=913774 RepID=A0A0C3I3X9_OIDMZ|nr:hypothetical protein OIDMADRAFT_23798 [Oidiodendron maius Zn]
MLVTYAAEPKVVFLYLNPRNSPRLDSRELSLFDEDFDAWPLLERGSDTLPLYLENEVLSVEGVELDTLTHVAPLPVEPDFTIIAAFLEFRGRLLDVYKYTRESRATALSLIMVANAFGNKDRMQLEIGSTF